MSLRTCLAALPLALSPLACAPERAVRESNSVGQSDESPLSSREVEVEGRRFLEALLSRDPARLAAYEPFPNAFLASGRPSPALDAYLYGEADGHRSSVVRVAEKGPLGIMLDGQNGADFTVLFYMQAHRHRMRDIEFLRENFMNEYFACEFTKSQGRWQLRNGVCFDETEGPYPNNDPDL